MNQPDFASLINLLGFTLGLALYVWLLLMVLFYRRAGNSGKLDFLLLTTAILGFVWNFGELYIFIRQDFVGSGFVSPMVTALAYSALGFLPPVVVYSAWKNAASSGGKILVSLAFALSSLAAILNFRAAIFQNTAPSDTALKILTFGSLALLGGLLAANFRQAVERKAVWITALLVFAVSAFHLSGEREGNSWLIELVAHQASLPLALAILLQDYRFAFADLFLKRALSLILLTLVALATYVFVAAPLLHFHETHDRNDAQAITLIITLWVATALIYPLLHHASVWFVDKILLQRADYKILQKEISGEIENLETAHSILETITKKIGAALTAGSADWSEISGLRQKQSDEESPIVDVSRVDIPTGNPPYYQLEFSNFSGGRRLLSDEIEMLETVAMSAARRIETIRISDERLRQEKRHEQTAKLAAEAELRALRAQLNPHFLFNALTTIGYLIQSAPEKAVETLMRLTQLLRGVLRSTGEFAALGDELKIIESYLEIEHARFEERLQVKIEVAPELYNLKIPTLILQPLVENAVKHGISNAKKGGEVKIAARLENQNLILEVADTGAGVSRENLAETRKVGVGLNNVEQRLAAHFGEAARLQIESVPQHGTTSRVILPLGGVIETLSQKRSKTF